MSFHLTASSHVHSRHTLVVKVFTTATAAAETAEAAETAKIISSGLKHVVSTSAKSLTEVSERAARRCVYYLVDVSVITAIERVVASH